MGHTQPLTAAQLAYLAAFDDYLTDATKDSERRREFALEVVLFEADVHPENADPMEINRSMGQQSAHEIGPDSDPPSGGRRSA